MCNVEESLFQSLSNTFKPQYNEITTISQVSQQHNDNAEKLMDWPRIAVVDRNYKEIDMQLKEQFIHGLNDDGMIIEISKEHISIKKINILQVIKYFYGQGE